MGGVVGGLHFIQAGEVDGQRLLDENILASLQRLAHETCVAIVAGDDGHGIDGRVGQHGAHVGGGFGKASLLAVDHAVDAAGGDDGMELRSRCLEGRNQHARGIVAGTDEAHHRTLGIEAGGRG
ncbi:hypothetical protein D3C78_1262110 [compost metagenome]